MTNNERVTFFFNTLELNLSRGLLPAEALSKTIESYAEVFIAMKTPSDTDQQTASQDLLEESIVDSQA